MDSPSPQQTKKSILNRIKESTKQFKPNEINYVLAIIPIEIDDDRSPDTIEIIGTQLGQTRTEKYTIDKLFYTYRVKDIIQNAKNESKSLRIFCTKPHPLSQPSRYTIIKIQTKNDLSSDWIDLKNISKIYHKSAKVRKSDIL